MRILILGAKGMLGGMLANIFKEEELTLWDRVELDIVNGAAVQSKIGELLPQVILNAAAYTAVDAAETHRDEALAVNESAVRNIALTAKAIDATLVHYSTDYVFPGTAEQGYTEDAVPGPPVNVYGESKLEGERAIQEINPRHFIIRTAWLYGPGGQNFVTTMLKLAATKPAVSVVNDQYGSPTFTLDVALVTRELLQKTYAPGVYHATNDGVTTWYDFACQIFAATKQSVTVTPITSDQLQRPAPRPRYSILLNTRGPKIRPWQAALDEYLAMLSNTTSHE